MLTTGSVVGTLGMLAFAAAPNPLVLYLAWIVIGVAMAATLYEPAMAVLVALDPARRHRTLAVVTVAGGLASTVFAPLGGWLVEDARLAPGAGRTRRRRRLGHRRPARGRAATGACPHRRRPRSPHLPAPPVDKPLRQLRSAVLFEQAAMIATTAYLIALLVDRGVDLPIAAAALGVMGLGKVAGRLLLLGPIGRQLAHRARRASRTAVQLAGLALPLAVTRSNSSCSQPCSSSDRRRARPRCCAP